MSAVMGKALESTASKPVLVIGSLATAQEGKYQSLITELEQTTRVDRQLLDRLIDEGVFDMISEGDAIQEFSRC